jgi:CheY-like chemotaxis protein
LFVTLPGQPLFVEGDPVRLVQVLSNLLNNAAKYTPNGGQIHLTVKRQGDKAFLGVRDNGMGIPQEVLPHIFEMFMQADRSLFCARGGLGIGLTLVKNLVDLHGGTVEAHSAGPGQGAEIVVCLPLLAEPLLSIPGASQTGDGQQTAAPSPGRRILVVDDNQDSANSLGLLAQIMGHEVRTAYDGPSALSLAAAFVPDVVLLDVGMPGMDGYEVARRLRQLPALASTVLVAQTGWGQEGDLRRAKEAGFDHHLVKPLDMKDLQKVLA